MKKWYTDEDDSKWLEVFKQYTMILFWVMIFATFIVALQGTRLGGGYFLLSLLGGLVTTFITYMFNILLLGFLKNTRRTKEVLEELNEKTKQ